MCLCCVWTDGAGCSPVFWNLLGIHSTSFDFLGHWGNGIWALLQRGQQYLCWAVWARFPAAIKEGDPFSSAEIWWFLPVEELARRLSHEFGRFSWFGAFMVYLARNQKKYLLFFPYRLQQIMLVFSKNQWTTKSPLEACCWNTSRCYKYIETSACMLVLLFSIHLISGIPWLFTISFLLNRIHLLALGTLLCLFLREWMRYIFSQLLSVAFDWVIVFCPVFISLSSSFSLTIFCKQEKKQTREGNSKSVFDTCSSLKMRWVCNG